MASESRERTCVLSRFSRSAAARTISAMDTVSVMMRVDVRVDEDVGDLVDGAGLVDGHGDEAGRPAREVEERPLVAGAAHDRDPVAGLAGRAR